MASETPVLSETARDILETVQALQPEITDAAESMEQQRRLPPDLVPRLKEAGIFRMGVPRAYGGSELNPMEQVRVVEELSRMNGSVGWLSMIGTASGFLAGYLEPAVAQRLFGGVHTVAAGQIRPPQKAEIVDGGYRVSGKYRFASGSQYATSMVCGCFVYENGQPRRLPNGARETRVMLVPASAVKIVDVWHTTGMRGTGSNDYTVDNVFVPSNESPNMAERPVCPGPLYPFPPLFLVSHAGVPLGIARSALDYVIDLSAGKEVMPGRIMRDDTQVEETVAWAEASLAAARSYVYSTLEDMWGTLCRKERLSTRQRAHYRMMITYSHQAAKQVIGGLYDTAATSSIVHMNPLDRDMRDILTACQHRVVHSKMYRPAGRMLLGLDADEPFF
jgi:alkylation response protein AidB-like acyl-CoA dehydrogenase